MSTDKANTELLLVDKHDFATRNKSVPINMSYNSNLY